MPTGKERVAFTVGSRRLLTIELRLARLAFTLDDILLQRWPARPDLADRTGLRVRSIPTDQHDALIAAYPGLLPGMINRYRRNFIRMQSSFDDYMNLHSAKTRQTMRRKARRFADANAGALDVREYRGTAQFEEFLRLALPLSQRTYQARLLDAGLPGDAAARARMLDLAAQDRVRAYLLFRDGQPAAYLFLPVHGETVIFAHLGFDPSLAGLSPGTVLFLGALERLFAERRFTYFDFTEGEGPHKALFGTDGIECESLVLLEPSLSHRGLLAAHRGFERTIRGTKAIARKLGAEQRLHQLLRT
ncbi:MAG: GNAT family N-acetyltransferase [Novosphingobium sp.]